MKNFSGKVALVTGGASGIGYGMVQNFLKVGMKVVVVDFNRGYLAEVRQALGSRDDVHFVQADVGDRDQVRAAAAEAIERFGKIHILCNNAGVSGGGNVDDPDFETWDRAMRVNLGGVVNGVKLIAPIMIRQGEGGHIVNTSSMAGIVPLPLTGAGAYQTSKFAVRGLTESLRMSLAPHGIGVSCLFPGATRTRMIEEEIERAMGRKMSSEWMDPVELGAYVMDGIRSNAPYILTHAEFRDEVREMCAMLDAAFPRDQVVTAGRQAFESDRRATAKRLRDLPAKD